MKFQNFSIERLFEKMLNLGIRLELNPECVKQVSVYRRQVYKWRRLNSFPLELIFDKHKHLLKTVTHIKSGVGSAHSRIKVPREFSRDLAYLLGAMRDGSLISSGGKHFIRLYDTRDAKWITKVKNIFKDVFETEMHTRYQKRSCVAYLDISSKPLFHMFKVLFNGCMYKDVPEIVKTAPTEIQKAYIEGFFDAEGHVPHSTKKYQIDLTQDDRKSLEFAKTILEKFGIKCGKISTHRLPIYGKENVGKFYHKFMLLNSLKTERLKLLLEATRSV